MLQLLTLFYLLVTITGQFATAADNSSASFVLKCSGSELAKIQKYWQWVSTETTLTEKIALYKLMQERKSRQQIEGKIAPEYYQLPIELIAQRLFTHIGLFLNAMSSLDKMASHAQHLILNEPLLMKKSIENAEALLKSNIEVIGSTIIPADKLTSWELCVREHGLIFMHVYWRFHFQASCDVMQIPELQEHKINGKINFTQKVAGGATRINFDLSGLQPGNYNKKYNVNIYEVDVAGGRCLKPGSHSNTEQTATKAENGRVAVNVGEVEVHKDGRILQTIVVEDISLFGPNNIIGKTVAMESTVEQNGEESYSETTQRRSTDFCCHIYQTYD
jgi:hypothetical protein